MAACRMVWITEACVGEAVVLANSGGDALQWCIELAKTEMPVGSAWPRQLEAERQKTAQQRDCAAKAPSTTDKVAVDKSATTPRPRRP